MKLHGFSAGIYSISLWISRLAIINILWIAGLLAGIVIFGFGPATVAMYSVLRKLFIQRQDPGIVKLFIAVYKEQFITSNKYALPVLLLGLFFYVDFRIIEMFDDWFQIFFQIALISLTIFYVMTVSFIFTVQAYYDVGILKNWKNALILGVLNPLTVIANFFVWIIIGYITLMVPGLIVFFSISVLAFTNLYLTFHRIEKHERQIMEQKV